MSGVAPDGLLVHFGTSSHPPIRLARGANLSHHLTVENSPVLFGCRTGICGTCLIRVEILHGGSLARPEPDEAELLSILCPGEPGARLACQLTLTAHIRVVPMGSAS